MMFCRRWDWLLLWLSALTHVYGFVPFHHVSPFHHYSRACPLPLAKKAQQPSSKNNNSHQGEKWQRHYDELVRYKEAHGDCNVRPESNHDKLAEWLQEQQTQYRLLMEHKKVRLTRKRAAALEKIGAIVEERFVTSEDAAFTKPSPPQKENKQPREESHSVQSS